MVTNRPRATLRRQGGTSFTYVTDGIESAIDQARQAAGVKDVAVQGGGTLRRQVIAAGLLDVLDLHTVPVVPGEGMRLFDPAGLTLGDREGIELRPTRVVDSPEVTHIRYGNVGRPPARRRRAGDRRRRSHRVTVRGPDDGGRAPAGRGVGGTLRASADSPRRHDDEVPPPCCCSPHPLRLPATGREATLASRPQLAASREGDVTRERLPEGQMDPASAYQIVHDDLTPRGRPRTATSRRSAWWRCWGSTFDGSYEPVAEIVAALDRVQVERGVDSRCTWTRRRAASGPRSSTPTWHGTSACGAWRR